MNGSNPASKVYDAVPACWSRGRRTAALHWKVQVGKHLAVRVIRRQEAAATLARSCDPDG